MQYIFLKEVQELHIFSYNFRLQIKCLISGFASLLTPHKEKTELQNLHQLYQISLQLLIITQTFSNFWFLNPEVNVLIKYLHTWNMSTHKSVKRHIVNPNCSNLTAIILFWLFLCIFHVVCCNWHLNSFFAIVKWNILNAQTVFLRVPRDPKF